MLGLNKDIFERGPSVQNNLFKEVTHSALLNHKTTPHIIFCFTYSLENAHVYGTK